MKARPELISWSSVVTGAGRWLVRPGRCAVRMGPQAAADAVLGLESDFFSAGLDEPSDEDEEDVDDVVVVEAGLSLADEAARESVR